MITINASTITNNLLSNKSYSYQISKQGYKFDSNAESCSVNANNFKKQLRHLKFSDTSEGINGSITSYIKDFVSEYNSFQSGYSEIDGSDKLKKYVKKFDQLIKDNSDALSDIGITRKSNGKLDLNTTTLSSATSSQLEALFAKDTEFIKKAESYSDTIYKETRKSMQQSYIEGEYASTAPTSSTVRSLATTLPSFVTSIDSLSKSSITSSNLDNVKSLIENFVNYYNKVTKYSSDAKDSLSDDASSKVDTINSITNLYEDKLNDIGISINSDKTLSYTNADGSSAISDDLTKLENIFGSSSGYLGQIKNVSEELFKSIVSNNSDDVAIDFYA